MKNSEVIGMEYDYKEEEEDGLNFTSSELEELENDELSSSEAAFISGYNACKDRESDDMW